MDTCTVCGVSVVPDVTFTNNQGALADLKVHATAAFATALFKLSVMVKVLASCSSVVVRPTLKLSVCGVTFS